MSDADKNEGTAGPQRRRRRRSRRRSGRPQDGGQGAKQNSGQGSGDGRSGGSGQSGKSSQSGQQGKSGQSRHSGQSEKSGARSGGAKGGANSGAKDSGKDSGISRDGSGSGGRSRRRRRGGRGRGQGSGGSGGSGASGGNAGRGNAGRGDSGAKDGTKDRAKDGSGKSSSRPGSKSGGGRSGQRRRQAGQSKGRPGRRPAGGRGPQRGAEQRDRMRTSIETSAGGLVVSGLAEAVHDDGSVDLDRVYVALIGRLDRRGRLLWSMPKGHVEPGEAHDSTAEREVWEETGIHGEVIAELGVIDYWFISDGTRIHKTVHHHLLRYVDGDLNDEDPEVTEVTWFPASTLVERLAYADERKLARRAHDLLPDLAKAEKDAGRATPR